MPGAMEFGLLGPLVVRSGGTEVPVRRGHQRALLAVLLLEANRPVRVEAITGALWGPAPPRSAPVAVRSYIRWLRLALGPAGRERISTQPRGYLIRVADGELDLARFERLLASARAAARSGCWQEVAGHARGALSCWRGEPLADIESDTLTLREVPRLAELRLQAVETRIEADLRLGAHAEVTAELRHLCAAHPLREHLHALLMLALYRCGRQAEALAAYQQLRAMPAAIQRIALAAATRLGDTAARALVGRELGTACAWLTDYDQARAHMTDSLGLYRKLGDVGGQARVHQSLGWVAGREGRIRDSLGHAEQALDMFRAARNRAGQAAALNALGYSHALLGEPERAHPFCRQALALNHELGDLRGEAHAWDSLGYAEHHLGHRHAGADCYQNALRLFRELGDRFNEAEILTHLGDARHAAGDQQEALAAWKQALVILDALHHPDAGKVRAKLGS